MARWVGRWPGVLPWDIGLDFGHGSGVGRWVDACLRPRVLIGWWCAEKVGSPFFSSLRSDWVFAMYFIFLFTYSRNSRKRSSN